MKTKAASAQSRRRRAVAKLAPSRPAVADAHRVVVKVGTRVLTHDDGRLALTQLYAIVEELGRAHVAGREVILVTSGAVGLGAAALGLQAAIPKEISERQMCAAVGQSRLMGLYQAGLSQMDIVAAQMLLTPEDFSHPERHANLNRSLATMLRTRVMPIVNANDVVATFELGVGGGAHPSFVENDRLAALVSVHVKADLLVLLTNVDGVFDKNPHHHDDARLVNRLDPEAHVEVTGQSSAGGLGGMRSKLEAAQLARGAGAEVVIANGRRPHALGDVLAGTSTGTWIPGEHQRRRSVGR